MVPAFPEADRQIALTDFRAVSVYLKCITLRYISFRFCLHLFYNFQKRLILLKFLGYQNYYEGSCFRIYVCMHLAMAWKLRITEVLWKCQLV